MGVPAKVSSSSLLWASFEAEVGNHVWQMRNLRYGTTVLPGVRRSGPRVVLRTRKRRTLILKEAFDNHSVEEYALGPLPIGSHRTRWV